MMMKMKRHTMMNKKVLSRTIFGTELIVMVTNNHKLAQWTPSAETVEWQNAVYKYSQLMSQEWLINSLDAWTEAWLN